MKRIFFISVCFLILLCQENIYSVNRVTNKITKTTQEGNKYISFNRGTKWIPIYESSECVIYKILKTGKKYVSYDKGISWQTIIESIENDRFYFDISPNPASDFLTIRYNTLPDNNVDLGIYNIFGRRVLHRKMDINTNEIKLSICGLVSGSYTVCFSNNNFLLSQPLNIIK